jgi:hypothetical protein
MEGYCSTGQSPQRAVMTIEEEEEEIIIYLHWIIIKKVKTIKIYIKQLCYGMYIS